MASSSVQVLARGEYFVHPQEVGRLVGAATSEGSEFWTPAVLLSVKDSSFGLEHARAALDDFALQDDVFCDDFTSTVILQHDEAIDIAAVASRLAESGCFQTILFKNNETTPLFGFLPQGPYFVHAKSINQAWKLYEDSLNAFVIPTVADDVVNPTSFSALQAVSQHAIFKSIAVPSRLYASPSKEKPLAGVRVSIKDNYDLKGIRTTMMNRAYNEIYPPCTSSAAYVTKLTQLGAIIVGKTKMSPFASAAELTDQWIVCPCPFNPRGDEYQFPSCSSTGAGASLAGYPWLDHSIGSDIYVFLRPSTAFSVLGLLMVLHQDRVSFLVAIGTLHRSLEDAKHLIKATLDVPDSSQFPKRLLYPLNFFPQADTEQQAMTEEFITIVEEFIGVQRTPISITDIWASSPPEEAGGKPLLEMSAVWPMYYDTYHTFDDFRSEYLEKFGTPAYVGPYMQTWWGIAVSFTEEERAQGVAEMKVFRTWFEKHIMGLDKDSVTDAVMIMPFGSAAPKYRDDPNKLPSIVGSFSVFYLPAVLQTPVLIVPIGQKPYDSRISGKKEYLPIVSSLMGAKGSDVLLLNLAEAVLKRAGWPTKVKTGREMFAVGDNVRNVLDGDIEYMG